MKKDIESLLAEQKANLDLDIPPPSAWEDIRAGIEQKPERNQIQRNWWKVAAVLLLATSLGLMVNNYLLQEKVEELATLGDISTEYRKLEDGYQMEINQLTEGISFGDELVANDLTWMLEELKMLEDINLQYRKDIGKEVDQELLVNALVDYYEKKIRLLKKLELEIKRQENEKRNTNSLRAI